jgi:simple sugar transport system ATP-binding protein
MLMLSAEDKSFVLNRAKIAKRINELSAKYALDVDPDALVSNLTVGQQQRVEIIKAVYNDSDLLILDEPTAVLTPNESDELFEIIKRFKDTGKSVIFISHKLREVMEISDRITVLRAGKVIDTVITKETNPSQLAFMMVGRKLDMQLKRSDNPAGDVVLQVNDLKMKSLSGAVSVEGLSLTVRAGEIYGIAGVDGNGQSELIKGITALLPRIHGEVYILGKELTRNCKPADVLKCDVAHIPEDRQRMGTVMTMDVTENLILHNIDRNDFKTFKLLDWKKLVSYAESLIKKYDIKTSGPRTPIKSLSGGNQQKLLVARELEQSPKLLLAVHPTRGVDIGAIDFIHRQIIDARNKGCAVLLISTELDEILTLSDRIGVIFKGKIKGELTREDVQLGKIALWMAGGDDAQATESISDSQKAASQRTIGS